MNAHQKADRRVEDPDRTVHPHSRVMFVDDEEGVRVSWNRFLQEQGFDVSTAEDGERAISRLNEEPVDVVVADLKMPRVDGLQLLEWIHDEQPDTRFILLTGYGNEEVERRARDLGAYEYLNKPISPETLAAVITAASHLDLLAEGDVEEEAVGTVEAPAEERVEASVEATPAADVATAPEEQIATEVEAAEVQAVETEAVEAEVAAEAEEGRLGHALKITAGLAAAPILGLAFVIFLPLIAFGALFWVLGETLMKGDEPGRAGA